MLTVRGLVAEMGLELEVGGDGADAPVRWVHISELLDPTPWLSGGELLLTTGIQLDGPDRQREFVRLLSGRHLAGLGFGTGFDHDGIPAALVEEAEALEFPLFEIPYELPFIALTEKAFTRLVNEQYEVLQRGIAIHKRLERLVLEESGLDEVVRALAAAIGGAVCVLSARGETIASRTFRRQIPAAALDAVREEVPQRSAEFAPDHPELAGRALVLPVSIRGRGGPQAWLVAARDAGGIGDFERLILQQAVTVVALELMRQRAMRDTERRLAGDVLAEALTGRPSANELAVRLRPFGVGAEAAVLVFTGHDGAPPPAQAEGDLDRFLADTGVGALVAARERLLCAVVDAGEDIDAVDARRPSARGACGRPRRAARRGVAAGAGRLAAADVPRGALRARGGRARQRRRAAGGVLPRPRRFSAAALAPGRRRPAALLRQRARPARGRQRRVRRRAAALARGVHRAERPVGEGGTRAVLSPAYAALPDTQSGGTDRQGPVERPRSHRVLAGLARARARCSKEEET